MKKITEKRIAEIKDIGNRWKYDFGFELNARVTAAANLIETIEIALIGEMIATSIEPDTEGQRDILKAYQYRINNVRKCHGEFDYKWTHGLNDLRIDAIEFEAFVKWITSDDCMNGDIEWAIANRKACAI